MTQKNKNIVFAFYFLANTLLYIVDSLLLNKNVIIDIILSIIMFYVSYRATFLWNLFFYNILKAKKVFRNSKVCLFYTILTWFVSNKLDGNISTSIANCLFSSSPDVQKVAKWIIYFFFMLLFEILRGFIFFVISRTCELKCKEKKTKD